MEFFLFRQPLSLHLFSLGVASSPHRELKCYSRTYSLLEIFLSVRREGPLAVERLSKNEFFRNY
jgi:hypothetical protein